MESGKYVAHALYANQSTCFSCILLILSLQRLISAGTLVLWNVSEFAQKKIKKNKLQFMFYQGWFLLGHKHKHKHKHKHTNTSDI